MISEVVREFCKLFVEQNSNQMVNLLSAGSPTNSKQSFKPSISLPSTALSGLLAGKAAAELCRDQEFPEYLSVTALVLVTALLEL